MTDLPVVSVIIPTYKRAEQFLCRSIESVMQQSYEHLEIIVVDDNPVDSPHRQETAQVMQQFADDQRIVYMQNERNLGGSLTRNAGLNVASGTYVTFLDDDDLYLPDKVATQVRYMQQNQLDMCFTDFRIHSMDDKLVDYRQYDRLHDCSGEPLMKYHIMHHVTGTNTYMFKRDVLLRLGGFDDMKMGQEFFLMLKTIERGVVIGYLREAHVINYLHPQERISNGQNKLIGERALYRFKRTKWPMFTSRQRMYIRFRHYLVMAFTCLRARRLFSTIGYSSLAILSSPLDMVNELVSYGRKIRRNRVE